MLNYSFSPKIYLTSLFVMLTLITWNSSALYASDKILNPASCIDIRSTILTSSKTQKVTSQLKEICAVMEKFSNNEHYPFMLEAIKSHAFLYTYADSLVKIPEASPDHLIKKIQSMWPQIDTMKPPSTGSMPTSKDETRFLIVNRNLFVDFDGAIDKISQIHEHDKVSCASGTIEYAENIMKNFNFSFFMHEFKALNEKTLIQFIKKYYQPQTLHTYLEESWQNVYSNIMSHKDSPNAMKEITQQLSLSMCYVARKSMPVATGQIQDSQSTQQQNKPVITTPNPLIDDHREIFQKIGAFAEKRCARFEPEKHNTLNHGTCGTNPKDPNMTYCKNFWKDFTHDLVEEHSATYTVSNEVLRALEANNYSIVKKSVEAAYEAAYIEPDEMCP